MIQAVHIRTESKFFISSLEYDHPDDSATALQLSAEVSETPQHPSKCQLRFNPNFEATSMRADSPYRILPKPSGSTGMEKPRHWVMLRD